MKQFVKKSISVIMATSLLIQSFLPNSVYALTGGPQSPEFSNFESVSTSNMVDPFTGDFTYNIPLLEVPGPNGGGYPISLSYHSGSGPEEEASWVGYGWTLNPGAINRSVQGFPDDANGDEAIYINKVGKNWTATAGTETYFKAFNVPALDAVADWVEEAGDYGNINAQLGLKFQLNYHNKTGLSLQYVPYMNASIALYSANISMEDGEIRYDYEIDPGFWVQDAINACISPFAAAAGAAMPKNTALVGLASNLLKSGYASCMNNTMANIFKKGVHSPYSSKSYTLYNNSAPTVLQDYAGFSVMGNLGAWVYPSCVPIGYGGAIFGSYTQQKPKNNGVSAKNYYGYLHSGELSIDENSLMDYTVEKQDEYNLRDNYLPIPYAAADMYSIVGEGISGLFRAYSSSIGHFRPNKQYSNTDLINVGLEFGAGQTNTVTIRASLGYDSNKDEEGIQASIDEGEEVDMEEKGNDMSEMILGGGHTLSVEEWNAINGFSFEQLNRDNENYYFKMIGDLGGEVKYKDGEDENGYYTYHEVYDKPISANLSGNNPSYSKSGLENTTNNEVADRVNFIAYHTNAEMKETDGGENKYKRYSLRNDDDMVSGGSISRAVSDAIGEFAVTNQAGSKYVYGLPVYAQNEAELSVDVDLSTDDIVNRTIVYKSLSGYMSVAQDVVDNIENLTDGNAGNDPEISDIGTEQKLAGVIRNEKYASSYLLTQITQPNYIDLTNDGPTDDDLGGWTKFNYKKLSGNYHWRIPFQGMFYNPGNFSDNGDDMANFRFGDKEVYYLESIETATHKAVFELSNRADGVQAATDFDNVYAGLSTATNATSLPLQKLDKITLYAKGKDGNDDEVLKRISLEYDYSCWPGIDNFNTDPVTGDPNYTSSLGTGKLTLKKMYTEYANVSNNKIAPYEFEYTYPNGDLYPTKWKYEKYDSNGDGYINIDDTWRKAEPETDEYEALETYGSSMDQEPAYSLFASDRWGSYQSNGEALAENMFPWLDPSIDVDLDADKTNDFDPAAWQLKQIKLPTQGQIHVQYEQDDYCFVQDRKAMAMVKLNDAVYSNLDYNNQQTITNTDGEVYFLDLNALGIADNNEAITDMEEWITKVMINGYDGRKAEQAFFQFLYRINSDDRDPELGDCNSAYVSGYIKVSDVKTLVDNDGKKQLYVALGSDTESASESEWGLPRDACWEFFKTTRGNLTEYNNDCQKTAFINGDNMSADGNNAVDDVFAAIYELTDNVFSALTDDPDLACGRVNYDNSYIRLPLPYEKKGGGIRVKRLLSYDAGIEDNDNMVYGHEYHYIGYNGLSSGVASNEPMEGGEENALIGFLHKREESSKQQVLAAGHDRSQFEGPLGENLLPSPSVGYARVLVRNIHSAPTHDGVQSYEYFTTKDYPFDKKYTFTDEDGTERKFKGAECSDLQLTQDDPSHFDLFVTKKKHSAWALQGYKFVLNGMNGQPKKQAIYSGDWASFNEPGNLMEISSTSYTYFEPGETLKSLNSNGQIENTNPGRSSEIIAESKKIADVSGSSSLSVEIGVAITYAFGIPLPFSIPIPAKITDETYIYTHVTTEINYFPPIVKSVKSYQDGAYSTAYNTYFNKSNGEPIVSMKPGIYDGLDYLTPDESETRTHHGKYYAYQIPASHYYDEMGSKVGYEGYTFKIGGEDAVSATKYALGDDYTIYFNGSGVEDVLNHFSAGDLIAINSVGSSDMEIYHVTSLGAANINVSPASGFYTSNASNGSDVDIKILQSGRANMLQLSAGSIATYGENFDPTSTDWYDDVISASATTYTNQISIDEDIKSKYGINTSETNEVETGEAGKWHVEANYVYNTKLKNQNMAFWSGTYQDFSEFNWNNPSSSSSNWLNTDEIESYAPDGNALQSVNLLDIHSAVKLSYNHSLPYLTAANAEYNDIFFESFEYERNMNCGAASRCFEDFSLSEASDYVHNSAINYAHTGSSSLSLDFNSYGERATEWKSELVLFSDKNRSEQIRDHGLSVKIWVKGAEGTITLHDPSASSSFSDIEFEKIARTGEWELYEAKLLKTSWSDFSAINTENSWDLDVTYGLEIDFLKSSAWDTDIPEVYIDDIRIQPLNSKMTAFVYDPSNYKVLATLDDQNFALLYQYNDEGKLIRKKKETIRGIKTLVETQYNIPVQDRPVQD